MQKHALFIDNCLIVIFNKAMKSNTVVFFIDDCIFMLQPRSSCTANTTIAHQLLKTITYVFNVFNNKLVIEHRETCKNYMMIVQQAQRPHNKHSTVLY